ncbi:MAG: hypothetical protein OEY49_18030 [Candidatus Heimdallarchaeota archaeon]|nr:hypothetical protein [Candidatus Heimdallarchaeota archaeon]
MDLDKKYQNLAKEHGCTNCNSTVAVPMHCGHPMHLEDISEGRRWVCWMGIKCGKKDYTPCCDNSTLPVLEPLGY